MEHQPKYLQGIALSALASVLLCGSALAVPAPTYPGFDPGADRSQTLVASVAKDPGARTLIRTSSPSLAPATLRGDDSGVAPVATLKGSRSKSRYVMPAMLLATLTPLALHHFGEPGDKSNTVQTGTPSSGPAPINLGNGLLGGGRGHGRGGDHNGDGDGEDCNDNEGGGDSGDGQVCDGGDNGDDHGDSGDTGGDCDNGGGGGNDSGGDHGGGGTNLPEPGTVPLVGAGLMMAIAFRWRRNK